VKTLHTNYFEMNDADEEREVTGLIEYEVVKLVKNCVYSTEMECR
jgi:hypothetical protein